MRARTITTGDLDDPRVRAMIRTHVTRARAETGRGSDHAMDADDLKSDAISFWALWEGETLIALGALMEIAPGHGEIKSMHTVEAARRSGAGSAMLNHIVAAAKQRGHRRLSLETGSWDYFVPARALYRAPGFEECGPFGDYVEDPNSVFMTRTL